MTRQFAPILGIFGSTLIALGSGSSAFSFRPEGWPWPPLQNVGGLIDRPAGALIIAAGMLVLILAWWFLRPNPDRIQPAGRVLIWWSLPLILIPPVMSGDPFLYADVGWIVRSGLNPYTVPLATAGGPYAAGVDPFWAGNGVAYPPLTLLTNWAGIEIGGLHPYWGVLGQRVFSLLGVGLIAVFLPKLARLNGVDPRWVIWFGLLNPYLIIHGIGGAHNDTLMAGVTVMALWLASSGNRWQPLVAAALIGVAMALKQQAGLAVVAVAGLPVAATLATLPFWQKVWLLAQRTVTATIVAVTVFATISLTTGFGFGWVFWLSNMGRAFSMSPSFLLADIATQIVNLAGGDPAWCLPVFTAVGVVFWSLVLVWLGWRYLAHPLAFVATGSLSVAFISNAVHPWYLILGLTLLGAVRVSGFSARLAATLSIGFLISVAGQYLFWWWWQLALAIGIVTAIAFWHGVRDLSITHLVGDPDG